MIEAIENICRTTVLAALITGLCWGCGPSSPRMAEQKVAVAATAASEKADPKDATPVSRMVVQLDVYRLTVPFGSVSNNDAFWKRVGEEHMDIAARDVLFLNGIRTGQAPIGEWEYFRKIIEANPAIAQRSTYLAGASKSLEMMMKKDVHEQCIFVSNPPKDPEGRTYDECENIMLVGFWPEARHAGEVRIKLCPMVRGMRRKLDAPLVNGTREFKYVSPEKLYDLKLETDVAVNSFLVVAPSECAKSTTSVGHAFLLKEGATERQEQVLILVPRVVGEMMPVASAGK